MIKPPTPIRRILDYEVRASWWVPYINIRCMQELASRYFAWKVRRKYYRWQQSLQKMHDVNQIKKQLNNNK